MQTVFTGIFANIYAHIVGILPINAMFLRLVRKLSLERFLFVSVIFGLAGIAGFAYAVWQWYQVAFSELNVRVTMRILVPSLTMIALSVQGFFNSFMLSILFLETKGTEESLLLSIMKRETRLRPEKEDDAQETAGDEDR
jgi:hypothetical protein